MLIIDFLFAFFTSLITIFLIRVLFYFIKIKLRKEKFTLSKVIKDTLLEILIIKIKKSILKFKYKNNGFTFLEFAIVLIIISLLSIVAIPYLKINNKFVLGYNNFYNSLLNYEYISEINNNYKIIPSDNTEEEKLKTKYWFKSLLEFGIKSNNGNIYIYYFKDLPYYDKKLTNISEVYTLNNIYYIGYPEFNIKNYKETFNLSNFDVKKVEIYLDNKLIKTITDNSNNSFNFIFFNNNIFLSNGKTGTDNIYILSSERKILNESLIFKLYDEQGKYKEIKINPFGTIEKK